MKSELMIVKKSLIVAKYATVDEISDKLTNLGISWDHSYDSGTKYIFENVSGNLSNVPEWAEQAQTVYTHIKNK